MTTTPNESNCPRCGKPVSLDAFEGLCPECLIVAGFGSVTAGAAKEKTNGFIPPTPAELAAHFPQLEILELLGRGGMGAVYKARQPHLDRIVALKILPPSTGHAPLFAERFVREAKALAKLHHPHIVTLYESGQANELFYFLMEFVDGVNLRQLLSTGTISPREALAIVPQICDALQFAHDRGIVHRDIKPENILLSKSGQVKIADFGVAKIVAGESTAQGQREDAAVTGSQTEAGKVIGTPQYMAPEQISHPLDVDNRADIYALGVVFYQMLTGELPVGRFEPPSRKVQIDVRLDDVILRALQKQPELRYPQASALKTQVETIATSSGTPGAGPAPLGASAPLGPGAPPVKTFPARRPSGLSLAAIGRWLSIAFSVFALTVFCGACISYGVLPKVYVTTAQIQVNPREAADNGTINLLPEVQVICSPDVLLPIIHDLELDKVWAQRIYHSELNALPPQDALAHLNKMLRLDVVHGTNMINISVSSDVPKEAADIANAVADRYKTMRDVEQDQFVQRNEASLRDQVSLQQKAVDDKEAAVAFLLKDLEQKNIAVTPDVGESGQTDLDARKRDLLSAQEDYNAREVLLDQLSSLPDDQFLSTLDGLGRQQSDIGSLRASILKEETDLTGLPEYHPKAFELRAELDAEKKELAKLATGERNAMKVDADMAKSRVALLQQVVEELTAKLDDGNSTLQPFHDAQHDLMEQQNVLQALTVRLREVTSSNHLLESPVRIIARAEPPEFPSQPNHALNLAIAVIAGLVLGIGLATLTELVCRSHVQGT